MRGGKEMEGEGIVREGKKGGGRGVEWDAGMGLGGRRIGHAKCVLCVHTVRSRGGEASVCVFCGSARR